MSELSRRGSRKRKEASQNHLKQQTLLDHFLLTRQPTPVSTLPPRDEEPGSQSIIAQTGAERSLGASDLPELSLMEDVNDRIYVGSLSGVSSTQSVVDVDTEQSQESCFVDQARDYGPPSSSYDVSSAASSPADIGFVARSNFLESGLCSSVSSSTSSRKGSPHIIDLTIEEGTAKAPILIEEPPTCELRSLTQATPSYIPFQRPPRRQQENHPLGVPFPNTSMQHIRDTIMSVRVPPINLARRRRRTSQPHLEPGPSFPLREATNIHTISSEHAKSSHRVRPSGHQADADAVLSCHGNLHPAVSFIFGLASELQDVKEATQQHWNQKWRPRRAEHILGNEKNACYLRGWMHALRLHFDAGSSSTDKSAKSRRVHKKRKRGGPRPEIVREVTRKRKKGVVLDGWLVDDDDDDDDADDGHFDDSEDFDELSLPSSWDPRESLPISFGRKIRNTILLVGPPGCGKTAAVYACAEELGWNVFEVYPGLGKRGGTHLDDLIGDVGKNHTLPQPLVFHRGRSEPPSPVKRRSTNAVDATDEPPEAEVHPQSAVLIEEADVVFADEAGFWPSVVAFIRSCRRPVIITCNDASLIPVETLPLQTTLTFSLPPTSLTSPLLAAICQVEGRPLASAEPEDVPSPEGQVPATDLRQRINQCQLGPTDSDCEDLWEKTDVTAEAIFSLRVKADIPTKMEVEQDGRKSLRILQQSLRGADLASYLDAFVLLSHPHVLEIAEDHPDDQVGYKVLKVTQRTMMPVQPEYYSRGVDVATAALRSFEGVLEQCFPSTPLDETCEIVRGPSREQYRSRLWEGLKTDPALECFVDLPRLYLDYRPLIGMMVTVEDQEIERAVEKVKGRGRRLTQNSQRRQEDDVRWLKAREELRGAVRAGGLCCSW